MPARFATIPMPFVLHRPTSLSANVCDDAKVETGPQTHSAATMADWKHVPGFAYEATSAEEEAFA